MTWCPSLGLAEDYGPLVWRSVCQFFGENDSNFLKYLNEARLHKIIGEMGIFTENYLKNGNSVARAVAGLIQFDLIELNL